MNDDQETKPMSSKIVDALKVSSFSEAVEKLAYLLAVLIGLGFLTMIVSLMGTFGVILLVIALVIGGVVIWRVFK